jgi:hypothetical protein
VPDQRSFKGILWGNGEKEQASTRAERLLLVRDDKQCKLPGWDEERYCSWNASWKGLLVMQRNTRRNLILFFILLGIVVLVGSFFLSSALLNKPGSPPTGVASPTVPSGTGTTGTCNGKGVVRNADGSYHFSRLHVNGQGAIVDSSNCIVHLVGLNMGGLFLAAAGHPSLQSIQWFKQQIPMNVVREAFNTYWWQTNVYVPNEHMPYQEWLKTVVKWQEQSGNYVILDAATQFHNPPCGTGVNVPCPSQNQATKNIPQNPQEKSIYQPPALAALSDLAKIYANDPAIIFDVWNEPSNKQITGISISTFFQDMNQRINTVRQYAPDAIVMVYQQGLSQIQSGAVPNYTQKNILFDTHIYQANWSPSDTQPLVNYAHTHGQAVIVGEWGGNAGTPVPSVLIPFLKENNVEACYFISSYIVVGKADNPSGLNASGQGVAAGYATILGSSS